MCAANTFSWQKSTQPTYSLHFSHFSLLRMIVLLVCWPMLISMATAQQEGDADLEAAFDRKIRAQSTRDLQSVVSLCKSAIEKGLDEEGVVQAKQLASTALIEHAEQLTKRIFGEGRPDPRWQVFRADALARLQEATELQPQQWQAYMMIAELNVNLPSGDKEMALEAINAVISGNAEDRKLLSKALFFRASLSEDERERIDDLNQAIKIDPENRDAIRIRGVTRLLSDDLDSGVVDIQQWLESDSVSIANYLEVVQLFLTLSEQERVDDEDESVDVDGESEQRLSDDKLAKEDAAGSTAESDSDSATTTSETRRSKLHTAAAQVVQRAIQQFPEEPRFLAANAQLLLTAEQFDEAILAINQAIEIDAQQNDDVKNLGFLLARGQIYARQKKNEQALADFQEILDAPETRGSELPKAAAGQARLDILIESEQFAEAIEVFRAMLSGSRNDLRIMRTIAILHNANDEPRKAIVIYNELLSTAEELEQQSDSDPDRLTNLSLKHETLRGRGDSHLSLGMHADAVADYDQALNYHAKTGELLKKLSGDDLPADEHTLNNLAWVLATSPMDEVRDGQRSIELANQAAEATQFKEAYILSTLASGYAEIGDFEAALKWINQAIEINQKDRQKEETTRNLEQKDSLRKEKDSYLEKQPWREIKNIEDPDSDDGKIENDNNEAKTGDDKDGEADQQEHDDQ